MSRDVLEVGPPVRIARDAVAVVFCGFFFFFFFFLFFFFLGVGGLFFFGFFFLGGTVRQCSPCSRRV